VESIPVGARDGPGHGREGLVDLALELEAPGQDPHLDGPALVIPDEQGPGQGKPRVLGGWEGPHLRGPHFKGLLPPGRREPHLRALGQFPGPLPRPLGEAPLHFRLEPPCDPPDQETPVPGVRHLPEDCVFSARVKEEG